MGVDFLLSKPFKETSAYELLQGLLEKREYYVLKRLYCGKTDYKIFVQGEIIDYHTEYPFGHEMKCVVDSTENQVIECRIYNHHNNIRIKKRNNGVIPVVEDEHIYSYDYRTGNSSASYIQKNIYTNGEKEYFKIIKYCKGVFDKNDMLIDFNDEVVDINKKNKKYN